MNGRFSDDRACSIMNVARWKVFARRPPVIIASLVLVAVLAFSGVSRLVNRFGEQKKALARHLYEHGLQEQKAGQPERAVSDFRAALSYAQDNFDYQLNLARALRDTGRTAEAETHLISLWEHSPQEGAVNLALGRLFAREQLLDKTIQYYHNAIYGFWPADASAKRRDTQFELITYLLQHQALPQAQAELIAMAPAVPREPGVLLRVAQLFAQAQDYEHALAQFQNVLEIDRDNPAALSGAGQAAFELGRYGTAQRYLQSMVHAGAQDIQVSKLLKTASLVLQTDPYAQRISDAERNRRVRSAFQAAGDRLEDCAKSQGIDLSLKPPAPSLPALKTRWLEMAPKVKNLRPPQDGTTRDTVMDLAFEIEQQAQAACGTPENFDQAILLLSQNRGGVER
jgi:tetratricopeptide (TPR) repeat protein